MQCQTYQEVEQNRDSQCNIGSNIQQQCICHQSSKKIKILFLQQDEPERQNSCRICLDSDNKNDMCSPCNCIGSMSLVHKKCFLLWATKCDLKRDTFNQNYFIECQVCKQNIYLAIKDIYQCRNRQQLAQCIQKKFLAFTIFLILGVVNLVTTLICLVALFVDMEQKSGLQVMILIVLAIITSTLFILILSAGIWIFCFKKQIYIKQIIIPKSNQQGDSNASNANVLVRQLQQQ